MQLLQIGPYPRHVGIPAMGCSGVICADGLPDVSGAQVFPAQQPGRRIRIDAAVLKDCFRGDAHCRQRIDMNRIDLKRPHIPCAIGVAQSFARLAAFCRKDAKQRGCGQASGTGRIKNAGRRQGACLR